MDFLRNYSRSPLRNSSKNSFRTHSSISVVLAPRIYYSRIFIKENKLVILGKTCPEFSFQDSFEKSFKNVSRYYNFIQNFFWKLKSRICTSWDVLPRISLEISRFFLIDYSVNSSRALQWFFSGFLKKNFRWFLQVFLEGRVKNFHARIPWKNLH